MKTKFVKSFNRRSKISIKFNINATESDFNLKDYVNIKEEVIDEQIDENEEEDSYYAERKDPRPYYSKMESRPTEISPSDHI